MLDTQQLDFCFAHLQKGSRYLRLTINLPFRSDFRNHTQLAQTALTHVIIL